MKSTDAGFGAQLAYFLSLVFQVQVPIVVHCIAYGNDLSEVIIHYVAIVLGLS